MSFVTHVGVNSLYQRCLQVFVPYEWSGAGLQNSPSHCSHVSTADPRGPRRPGLCEQYMCPAITVAENIGSLWDRLCDPRQLGHWFIGDVVHLDPEGTAQCGQTIIMHPHSMTFGRHVQTVVTEVDHQCRVLRMQSRILGATVTHTIACSEFGTAASIVFFGRQATFPGGLHGSGLRLLASSRMNHAFAASVERFKSYVESRGQKHLMP